MEIPIYLHFLEPFRLVEWCEPGKRNNCNSLWQRCQTFARWHRSRQGNYGRPYITGTLLRSAVLRAVEEELARQDTPWTTCGGLFVTERGDTPAHLRHRSTVRKRNHVKQCMNRQDACPLCLLLGLFDEAGKGRSQDEGNKSFDVRFSNLSLSTSLSPRNFSGPEELGLRRTINRIDDFTGKAHDFFPLWEIDGVKDFHGTIILADDLPQMEEVKSLLLRGLGFVDRLCGARCVITNACGDESGRMEDTAGHSRAAIAAEIQDLSYARLRTLADAVRNLRQLDPGAFFLPHGRKDKDGGTKDHYIWDTSLNCTGKLRNILAKMADSCQGDKLKWRRICEIEGQALYEKSKAVKDAPSMPGLHLGAAEQIRKANDPDSYTADSIQKEVFSAEWIITGQLRAETPFAVGMDSPIGNDQTALRTLVDRNGRYRLPRSTLRGILRRDLSLVTGDQGCRRELGPARPCVCPVCRLLRAVTVADMTSECAIPADIRQRIRRNAVTGTVADGALFDTEAGPMGARFSFVLRYRGDKLPEELSTVLSWWREGKCFAGGDRGVGRGRFALKNAAVYRWDLSRNEARNEYASNQGLRAEKDETNLETWGELLNGLEKQIDIASGQGQDFPWRPHSWTWSFSGPLLQGDPLAALNTDSADIVSYERMVLQNGKTKREPVLRGEGLRGMLRTAVGRAAGEDLLIRDHQDCTCVLCKLFGSEHQAGIVRVEDAAHLDGPLPHNKRLDHVSIDRFDQSVVEKYDDRPLIGTPGKPLIFAGSFWVKEKDLNLELRNLLDHAWRDIAAGLYSLGGKGGIGYGWVSGLRVDEQEKVNEATFLQEGDALAEDLHFMNTSTPAAPAINPQGNAIYNPHYFLPPDDARPPARLAEICSHHLLDDSKFTGRITCSLDVITPLIIPDTEQEQPPGEHHQYPFFTLDNWPMIPGAPLRAAVSQVYEVLTNSCFRVMKQRRYLSWRMKTDGFKDFLPGQVCNGGKQIKPLGQTAIRLPLYDDLDATKEIKKHPSVADCIEPGQEKSQKTNLKIAAAAKHNQKYLADLPNDRRKSVLLGLEKVPFWVESLTNNDDEIFCIARLEEKGKGKQRHGFLKITGPNNANVSKTEAADGNYQEHWEDPLDFSFRLTGTPRCLPNTQQSRKFPRPGFTCVKNGKEYTVTKRCERIFEDVKSSVTYGIPDRAREQYRDVLAAYRTNAREIAKAFRTRFPEESEQNCNDLKDGDLVYFKTREREKREGKTTREVETVIPVSISREVDTIPLGSRVPAGFQPCSHVCLEDCVSCSVKNSPVPLYREGYPVNGLCPACRLFGSQMHKGRVNFGFAHSMPGTAPEFQKITLPLLERPRPTWVLPIEVKEKKTSIPGRKFYLRHNGWQTVMNGMKNSNGEKIQPGPNNATVEAVMPGSRFTFDIICENLSRKELGLLLYSLELESGMAHSVGRGKPLGFGSVKITAMSVEKRIGAGAWGKYSIPQHEASLRRIVAEALKEQLGENWSNQPPADNLRRLLTMLPRLVVRYPELTSGITDTENPPGYMELKKDGYDAYHGLRLGSAGPQPWFHGH